jgi:hypothetical protein
MQNSPPSAGGLEPPSPAAFEPVSTRPPLAEPLLPDDDEPPSPVELTLPQAAERTPAKAVHQSTPVVLMNRF